MSHPVENLTIAVMSKGVLAELRMLIERCEDKDTARAMYREMRQLEHKVRVKFRFEQKLEARVG